MFPMGLYMFRHTLIRTPKAMRIYTIHLFILVQYVYVKNELYDDYMMIIYNIY